MNHLFQRSIAALLIVCTTLVGMPLTASANLIATEDIATATDRDTVRRFMDRDEVRTQLQERGVDATQAKQRVDQMTEAEVQQLASQIDTLPAGGDVLGVVFTVFIILLITDIIGLTSVFPFTRPIR